MEDVPKIVLKRLQETSAPGPHPDADLLTAFAEQSLAESERARVMEHLARCGDCREVLSLALPAMELVAVAASSTPASTTPARSRWFTWPVLRWGVAAAGIIALASIGVVQYRQRLQNHTLVSSLASRNETTAAPQPPLPQPAPAYEVQESVRQAEKEKQAQVQKQAREQNWALSLRPRELRRVGESVPVLRAAWLPKLRPQRRAILSPLRMTQRARPKRQQSRLQARARLNPLKPLPLRRRSRCRSRRPHPSRRPQKLRLRISSTKSKKSCHHNPIPPRA